MIPNALRTGVTLIPNELRSKEKLNTEQNRTILLQRAIQNFSSQHEASALISPQALHLSCGSSIVQDPFCPLFLPLNEFGPPRHRSVLNTQRQPEQNISICCNSNNSTTRVTRCNQQLHNYLQSSCEYYRASHQSLTRRCTSFSLAQLTRTRPSPPRPTTIYIQDEGWVPKLTDTFASSF